MADIYLCGHIHDIDTINYSTHENSLLTLVTGIGWPQNFNEEQKSDRRYSIYEINPVRNSCCIIMRKSKHNSYFDYDYTIYTNENEQSSRKIVYPLHSPQKDLPYLSMATPERINEKNFFISSEVSTWLPKVSRCVSGLHYDMCSTLIRVKLNFLDMFAIADDSTIRECFTADWFSNYTIEEIRIFVNDFLLKNASIIPKNFIIDIEDGWKKFCDTEQLSKMRKNEFYSYLIDICNNYTGCIKPLFPDNATIRPHFREYCPDSDKYVCKAFSSNSVMPKDVKWGGLIEKAFFSKTPLIYSANSSLNNTETDWQEFITVVPNISSMGAMTFTKR